MQKTLNYYSAEIKAMSKLCLPIVVGQLGLMLMGIADTIQVGNMPTQAAEHLAAAGFANGLFILVGIFGLGALQVIAPLVSKASTHDGSAHSPTRLLVNGVWVAACLGVLLSVFLWLLANNAQWFNQPADIERIAPPFLFFLLASMLPMLIFLAIKQFADGLGHTRVAMYITLSALLLNIGLNYLLIYGNYGFPALRLNGAGLATLIARLYMLLAILVYVYRSPKFKKYLKNTDWKPNYQAIIAVLKLGIPAGFHAFFEVAAFVTAVVMMGWLGKYQVAAHQIAINMASVTYMMTTGISVAGSIRVGLARGHHSSEAVLLSGKTALLMGGGFMLLAAMVFITAKNLLVAFFISDNHVVPIALSLMTIAGFFQLSDGIQSVALGLLRGLEDVNIPTVIVLVAYWVIGLPLGYWLAFCQQQNAVGIWIGLLAGLTVSAILLTARFFMIAKQPAKV